MPRMTKKQQIASAINTMLVSREMQATSDHPDLWRATEQEAAADLLDLGVPVVGYAGYSPDQVRELAHEVRRSAKPA